MADQQQQPRLMTLPELHREWSLLDPNLDAGLTGDADCCPLANIHTSRDALEEHTWEFGLIKAYCYRSDNQVIGIPLSKAHTEFIVRVDEKSESAITIGEAIEIVKIVAARHNIDLTPPELPLFEEPPTTNA